MVWDHWPPSHRIKQKKAEPKTDVWSWLSSKNTDGLIKSRFHRNKKGKNEHN